MKKSRFTSIASLSLFIGGALGLSGCDTLKARSEAQEGVKLYKEGRPLEAAEKFEAAQALDPTIPTIWLNLGFADLAVYQARVPQSIKGANRAIESFEKYLTFNLDAERRERATSYLIQTFVDTSHYSDAVKWFQPQIEKNDPQALATLGTIASKVGNYEDSVKWYTKRVESQPENGEARISLAVQLWDHLKNHASIVGKERVDLANQALVHLKKAISVMPDSPNPYLYANLVYRERSPNLGEDARNLDLTLAKDYFVFANAIGKAEISAEQKKDLAAAKADLPVTEPKADAAVNAALAAMPPPGQPCVPNGPCAAPPGQQPEGVNAPPPTTAPAKGAAPAKKKAKKGKK